MRSPNALEVSIKKSPRLKKETNYAQMTGQEETYTAREERINKF